MNDPTLHDDDARVDDFDALLGARLTTHYRSTLDPHVGTTTCKLDKLLGNSSPPQRLGSAFRWAAAAMLLLGLGVALAAIHARTKQPTHAPALAAHVETTPTVDAIVTTWAETYDAGNVLVDPQTPARMLHCVQYEQTDWKDASGQWRSALTSPRHDVILLDLEKQ